MPPMTYSSIAFALGIFLLQQQAGLPEADWLIGAASAGVVLAAGGGRWRLLLPLGTFLLGIAWAGALGQMRVGDALAAGHEGRDVELVGVVAELPQRFDNGLRFDLAVEQAPAGIPTRISL